jgi:LmbE family N-acetylglucosaminyl deacetylase
MMGWDANTAPGAFWGTPVDEAGARLAELMRRHRPDVVVTYDENGFYGHPDHIQANRITTAALDLLDADADGDDAAPAKVYWTTVPRSQFAEFGRVMRELGVDWDDEEAAGDAPPFEMGLPDDEVTTWVDTSMYGQQKYDALAEHASQTENIVFLRLGVERMAELMGTETFVRVRDTTGTSLPEHDLFDGLR